MTSRGVLDDPPAHPADLTQSTEEYCPEEGPLISEDALHSAIKREFRKLPTWHTALLSLLHVVFVVLAVILALTCVIKLGDIEECTKLLGDVKGDSIIAFGKAFMWLMVQIHTMYSQQSHSGLRRRGYMKFYRQTKSLKFLPLTVHSAGTAMFLAVQATGLETTTRTYLIIGILVVEVFLVVPILVYYIVSVSRFNQQTPAPDVCEEDYSQSISRLPTETGFRVGSGLEEVVEKQSDLIEYLMEHNRSLSKRLLNQTVQH